MVVKPLVFALFLCLFPQITYATPTFALWGDTGSGLRPDLTTNSADPFDVVVTLDSSGYSSLAAEWVMLDLRSEFPGVYALQTRKINDTPLDLGSNEDGEYLMAFGSCAQPGNQVELVRVTYADFGGTIGTSSTLLTLRGFSGSDSRPSSFSGQPGFVDCQSVKHSGEMGGNDNAGALCVNCYEPPTTEATMAQLKSRF